VFRRSLQLALVAAVSAAAGCDRDRIHMIHHELLSAPPATISVYQLAGRLGMSVSDASAGGATLRDARNVAVLFADPSGRAYVNGRQVGPTGGFVGAGGILFVPQMLETDLRMALLPPLPVRPPVVKEIEPVRLGKVVLDAGHGGHDPGAISILGFYEKSVNLPVALATADKLRARHVEVVLTRSDDRFLTLEDRADIANRNHADLFVSIHADSARNRAARGFTVYIARSPSQESVAAAQAVERHMRRLGADSRGIQKANFRVLVRSMRPAVLVELGFLSNRQEASLLARDDYRARLATAFADAVCEYLQAR